MTILQKEHYIRGPSKQSKKEWQLYRRKIYTYEDLTKEGK